MFGGTGSNGITGDTWSFSLTSNTWQEINTTTSPPPRFSMVYGVSNRYYYIATGEGPNKVFFSDIWRFSLDTDTWEELIPDSSCSDTIPAVRYGSAGGIYPGQSSFLVSLGFSGDRHFDTYSFDLTTNCWTKQHDGVHPYNPSYPHGRCLHAGTMVSSNEYVMFGGCLTGGGTGGPCPSGDSWMLNVMDGDWEELPSCASPRTRSTMVMMPQADGQKRIILYGGKETSKQVLTTEKSDANQVVVFNPNDKEWTLKETTGDIPSKRYGSAMATGDSGVFMFGGGDIKGGASNNDIYLLHGNSSTVDLAPSGGQCKPVFINMIMLHGIFMVLSWGILLQWGAFIARYLRHKDPLWFKLHRAIQVSGVVLSFLGLIFGIVSVGNGHFRFAHGALGLVVTILGLQQPFNALIRPHKPEDGAEKTTKRFIWEFLHKNIGRLALLIAIVQISMGLFLALAHTAIWALWYAYVILLIICYIVAEVFKICKGMNGSQSQKVGLSLNDVSVKN